MTDIDKEAKLVAKAVIGGVQELARSQGLNAGSPHGAPAQIGAWAVGAVSTAAPVVAAKAGAAIALASGVAAAAAPLAVAVGIGLGAAALWKRLR